MRYDSTTGHRLKGQAGAIDWVHSRMKKSGDLPQDWELTQCLFEEHLLTKHPEQPVAVVEAEKTAFVCSAFIPSFVWVATGGRSQLNDFELPTLFLVRGARSFSYMRVGTKWEQFLT